MNKIIFAFGIFLLLEGLPANGQENELKELPYIEVAGSAEIKVVPDQIYISIVLREKQANRVKVTVDAQEEQLKQLLKTLGIDLKQLSIAEANSTIIKLKRNKTVATTKKEYTLLIRDAASLQKVFTGLENMGMTSASIANAQHSKIDSLSTIVKIQAIKAAKTEAQLLLQAIGEKPGKPLRVTEGRVIRNLPTRNIYALASTTKGLSDSDDADTLEKTETDIEFQMITISANVLVRFAIE